MAELEKKLLDKYAKGISILNEKEIQEYFLFYFLDLLNSKDKRKVTDSLFCITNCEWKNKDRLDSFMKGFLYALIQLVKVKEQDREIFLGKFKNTLSDLSMGIDEYYTLLKEWRKK